MSDPFAGLDPLAGMSSEQRRRTASNDKPKAAAKPAVSALKDPVPETGPALNLTNQQRNAQPSNFAFMNQSSSAAPAVPQASRGNANASSSSSNRRPANHPPSGALKGLMQHVGSVLAEPDLMGPDPDDKTASKRDPYAVLREDSGTSVGSAGLNTSTYRASKVEEKPFSELVTSLRDMQSKDIAITLKVATKAHFFTCEQLGRLFDALTFGEERVSAAEIVAPRLLDFHNHFSLLTKCSTDDERNKMVAVFRNAKLDPLAKQSQIQDNNKTSSQSDSFEDAFGMQRAQPKPKEKKQDPLASIFDSDNTPGGAVIQPTVNAQGGPPGLAPIAQANFDDLKRQLGGTGFGDKTMLLKTSAQINYFTCKQLAELCQVLNFSEERLFACEVVAPKLLDPTNKFEVLSQAGYDDERQKMQHILSQATLS